VELVATPGPPLSEAPDDPAAPGPLAADAPVGPSAAPYVESAAGLPVFPPSGGDFRVDFPSSFSGGLASTPATPGGPAAGDVTESAASIEPEPGPPAPAAPGAVLRARSAVDFWEQVPTPTALLVPAVLGVAVLIGVVLGPRGRPSPAIAREGGLSRALARRGPGADDDLLPPAATP
jgi:hypothetical protein